MAGPFLGLSMASNALRSFQRALDTSGHNVANVNTRGYSRQTVEFQTNQPLDFYSGRRFSVGQGTTISGINRIKDSYLEASFNQSSGSLGKYKAQANGLMAIDRAYGEPQENGIAASLESFFNAWSAYGSNPADPAAQAKVKSAGQTLTDRVRSTYKDFMSQQANTQKSIVTTIDRVNSLGQEIADLNKQILQNTSTGAPANDLMDRRDLALNELSGLVNVQRESFADGQYAIYAAGFTLVDSAGARPFPTTYDATTSTVTDGAVTYAVKGGALAGLMSSYNDTAAQMSNLDTLSNTLREQVNTLHQSGTNSLGNTGVDFFNGGIVPPFSGAIDFDLSVAVKADTREIVSGISGNQGDGGIALGLAQMRDTSFAVLGNQSFSNYFQRVVSDVAHRSSYLESAAGTEEAVQSQIDNQRQAVSGVSLDDEMANMMKYQRTYQAMARALTVFDQVANDLIGMLQR